MKFWRNLKRDVLRNLEIDGVYLTADQARAIAAVLGRSAPPMTPRESEIVARFHMRVERLGSP